MRSQIQKCLGTESPSASSNLSFSSTVCNSIQPTKNKDTVFSAHLGPMRGVNSTGLCPYLRAFNPVEFS